MIFLPTVSSWMIPEYPSRPSAMTCRPSLLGWGTYWQENSRSWEVVAPNMSDIRWVTFLAGLFHILMGDTFPNKLLQVHQLALQLLHTKQCANLPLPMVKDPMRGQWEPGPQSIFSREHQSTNVRITHHRISGEPLVLGSDHPNAYCVAVINWSNLFSSESPLFFLLEILNYHASFDSVHPKCVFANVFMGYTSWLPRHCSHKILSHRAIPHCGIDSRSITRSLGKRQTVPHMVKSMRLWHHCEQCPPLRKTDLSKLRVGTAKPFARLHNFSLHWERQNMPCLCMHWNANPLMQPWEIFCRIRESGLDSRWNFVNQSSHFNRTMESLPLQLTHGKDVELAKWTLSRLNDLMPEQVIPWVSDQSAKLAQALTSLLSTEYPSQPSSSVSK